MSRQRIAIAVLLSLVLIACGKETDLDKIGDCQMCLDKLGAAAAPAEVNSCLDKIDGIETTAAFGLRCAGSFMKEGFLDASKLINAMTQLDNGGTASFMKLITFTSAANISTDTDNAYKAFNYCLKGEGKGSTLIASFGYVAMAMYNYMHTAAGTCDTAPEATGYDFNECLTNYGIWSLGNPGSPLRATELANPSAADASVATVQGSVGAILISTANISCSTSNAIEDLCVLINDSITAAGGTGNSRAVATQFFKKLLGI